MTVYFLRMKFKDGIGWRGHVSDGFLVLLDQKPIAIEVEIGCKNKWDLKAILRGYMLDI